jgi:hypothetical protein
MTALSVFRRHISFASKIPAMIRCRTDAVQGPRRVVGARLPGPSIRPLLAKASYDWLWKQHLGSKWLHSSADELSDNSVDRCLH